MANYLITPKGDVVLVMTPSEARGLLRLAQEGAEGLLNDAAAARGYIGNGPSIAAARRARNMLARANEALETTRVE